MSFFASIQTATEVEAAADPQTSTPPRPMFGSELAAIFFVVFVAVTIMFLWDRMLTARKERRRK